MVSFTEPESRAQCPSKMQFPHSLPEEKNGAELGRAAHTVRDSKLLYLNAALQSFVTFPPDAAVISRS